MGRGGRGIPVIGLSPELTYGRPSLSKTTGSAARPSDHSWQYMRDPLAWTASVTYETKRCVRTYTVSSFRGQQQSMRKGVRC